MWPKCLKNIKISSRALKLDMYWMELNHTYNEPRLKSTKKSPQIGSFTSVACALVTDVSDEWWKIERARFFVPPFVKILISHSWIMRQLDSWRRIISSSIGHLSFIIKWKVTNSFFYAPNIRKKIHNVTNFVFGKIFLLLHRCHQNHQIKSTLYLQSLK